MAKLKTFIGAVSILCAVGGGAIGQTSRPIASGDVVGEWLLVVTPSQRQGMDVSVESRDGGPAHWPLTITNGGGNRLACVIRARPGQCRIEGGKLVVVSTTRSGGASLTFTLTQRTDNGLTGVANLRARFIPFVGGEIGSVIMTRR